MLKININDYIKTGEGATAESFETPSDSNILIKLYHPGFDKDVIIKELDVARKVYALGIPSPEPGELVTDGNRLGLRYRKVVGKRSFARAISQEPERIPEFVHEFADYAKKLHSVECPNGMFPNAKELFLTYLEASKCADDVEKSKVKDFIINKIPNCNAALHGDLHYGNLLTTLPQGAPMTTPHEIYFIDLSAFSYGSPLFDIAMTYNIGNLSDEAFLLHDMHYGKEISKKTWDYFVQEYFFGPEELGKKWFGASATRYDIEEELKFYAMIKLFFVEYAIGEMPANYIPFIRETLKRL